MTETIEAWLEAIPLPLIYSPTIILTLFAAIGLFTGLIVVNTRWRTMKDDVIAGTPGGKSTAPRWDVAPTPVPLAVVALALLAGGGIPGAVLTLYFGPILGLPLAIVGSWLLPSTLISTARNRWVNEMEAGALNLLQLLILKLQSGQSLLPALDDLAQNSLRGPIVYDLKRFVVGPVEGGANITQVLSQLRDSPRYKNTWRLRSIFRHLATATRAQMPGHKISERLQTLQQALVDTYALQLELQADLAQAKYSRWIVSSMIPITVLAMNFFAPDITENLFQTIMGQIALVFAVFQIIALNVVGQLIARMPPLEL